MVNSHLNQMCIALAYCFWKLSGKRNECSNQPENAENLLSNVSMEALM